MSLTAWLACCGRLAAQPDDDPAMATLDRDATRFAECVATLQADCVFDMTHVESFAAAGVRTPYIDRKALRELWKAPLADDRTGQADPTLLEETSTERMTSFAALAPREPFSAGGRLYAFVPFHQTNTRPTGWLDRTGFLIAISEDEGESWRFNIINGYHLLPQHVAQIYPELAGRDLPPIRNELVPLPTPVISRYLRTTDGQFSFVEGAASYSMRFDVRRRLRADVDLVVTFDNPALPERPATMSATLAEDEETLEVRSPALTAFEPGKYYEVVVSGFEQSTGDSLFEHRQALLFNPTNEQYQLLRFSPPP